MSVLAGGWHSDRARPIPVHVAKLKSQSKDDNTKKEGKGLLEFLAPDLIFWSFNKYTDLPSRSPYMLLGSKAVHTKKATEPSQQAYNPN